MATAKKRKSYAVRNSPIHGRGVFATKKIRKGTVIVEYKGQRTSYKKAVSRPDSDPGDSAHTFLFELDDGRAIGAGVRGNAARWINHSCDPNCETEESDDGRVYIQAMRDIRSGEELNYDYALVIDERMTPALKKLYACHCGAKNCRGTMLALKKRR